MITPREGGMLSQVYFFTGAVQSDCSCYRMRYVCLFVSKGSFAGSKAFPQEPNSFFQLTLELGEMEPVRSAFSVIVHYSVFLAKDVDGIWCFLSLDCMFSPTSIIESRTE